MDPAKPEEKAELDRLGVAVHDISSFSTDYIGHGAFAEAPDVVKKIGAHIAAPRAGEADKMAIPDFRGDEVAGTTNVSQTPPPPPVVQKVESSPLPPVAGR